MEKLTPEQMEEVLIVHETAEFANDLDAVMATLSANPKYELPSIGWHIEGEVGVRELYKRWLSGAESRNVWAEKRVQAFSTDENALIRDAYVFYDGDDGQRVTARYSTAISFEGV
jgi:hypothetical protein